MSLVLSSFRPAQAQPSTPSGRRGAERDRSLSSFPSPVRSGSGGRARRRGFAGESGKFREAEKQEDPKLGRDPAVSRPAVGHGCLVERGSFRFERGCFRTLPTVNPYTPEGPDPSRGRDRQALAQVILLLVVVTRWERLIPRIPPL